jgi:6-phosphogluconolactonase
MIQQTIYTPNVAQSASDLFIKHRHSAISERGRFVVVLSGGSTPLKMYEILKSKNLSWDKVHFFWGDERFVPHTHPDSNYGAAKRAFLDTLAIPKKNIHPVPYGQSITQASQDYAQDILNTLGENPLFDLTFLGLGDDAHTASLFPGTGAVFEQSLVTICRPTTVKHERLTLSANTLSQSHTVAFLVSGESKRKALESTLEGSDDFDHYPARAIKALENLVWITDVQLNPKSD